MIKEAVASVALVAFSPHDNHAEERERLIAQAQQLVLADLSLPAEFGRVYLSPVKSFRNLVCGLVQTRGTEVQFRAFIANPTTGAIFLENYTLQFTSAWNRICYPYPGSHDQN